MPLPGPTHPDELYHHGLEAFQRGDWQAAVSAFGELLAANPNYPGAEDLLADARLKLQFEGAAVPIAKAPPRRRPQTRVVVALGLAGVVLIALIGVAITRLFTPEPASAVTMAVVIPPTATPEPTALPPTPQPTDPPAPTPAVSPSPTVAPSPTVSAQGSVAVWAADGANFVSAPPNIQLILDASGSMLADAPGTGKKRWEIAQDAMLKLVNSGVIPMDTSVGVVTYGRNRGDDCADLEVAQSMAPFSIETIYNTIYNIKPAVNGRTPLGASLALATQELDQQPGGGALILMTDGIESCDGDPVAEAQKFVDGRTDRNVHVIGFAIDDPDASEKLRQIAEKGNGLYFDVSSSEQLAEALQQAVVVSYEIATADGQVVHSGQVGDEPQALAPGPYVLRINANPALEQPFVVPSGGSVEIRVSQQAGVLAASIMGAP